MDLKNYENIKFKLYKKVEELAYNDFLKANTKKTKKESLTIYLLKLNLFLKFIKIFAKKVI